MPNPVSRTAPLARSTRRLRRLDVLVDEPPLMQPRDRRDEAEREVHERPHRHRLTEQPLQQFAARVLQHQHGPTAFADELQRPHRPRSVELILQSVFVSKAIKNVRWRVLHNGHHGQHGKAVAIGTRAPPSAEHTMSAVFPQDLETVLFLTAERKE